MASTYPSNQISEPNQFISIGTPLKKIEAFSLTMDKLVINMKDLLKDITPLLIKTLIIIGVIFIFFLAIGTIVPFSVFTLYEHAIGLIGKDNMKLRFYIGGGIYALFWSIIFFLSIYIIAKIKSCYSCVKPQLVQISKDINELQSETMSIYNDFRDIAQDFQNPDLIKGFDAMRSTLRQRSAQRTLPPPIEEVN